MTKEAGVIEFVPIGRIAGVFGIRGEVKVQPFEGMEELGGAPLFLMDVAGKSSAGIAVNIIRRHKGLYIASLEGYSIREDAAAFTGRFVCVARKDLPELDQGEYYFDVLDGMEVHVDDGRNLGRVVNVFSTGSNDVIEVKGAFGTVLIPAIEGVIKEVDVRGRRIVVSLMEGLVEAGSAKKK